MTEHPRDDQETREVQIPGHIPGNRPPVAEPADQTVQDAAPPPHPPAQQQQYGWYAESSPTPTHGTPGPPPPLQPPRPSPPPEATVFAPPSPPSPPPPVPVPVQQQAPAYEGTVRYEADQPWHRFHYPIGVFLIAYGLTALLASVLGWSAHRKEIAGYLGDGVATPVLAGIKAAEVLIILITLAGVLRRRDVWFLPALFGWMAGFGVFCVLDVAKGKSGRLVEHAAYVVLFAVLLGLSYALGVKARVGREAPVPDTGKGPRPGNLSRTQEIALAALNRWQRAAPPQHEGVPGPHGTAPQVPPQRP